jgi:hypothetical protein
MRSAVIGLARSPEGNSPLGKMTLRPLTKGGKGFFRPGNAA